MPVSVADRIWAWASDVHAKQTRISIKRNSCLNTSASLASGFSGAAWRRITTRVGRARADRAPSSVPGACRGPNTPVWVSDNGADVTTLYNGAVPGNPESPVAKVLTVSIPGGAPTGQVFNDTSAFLLPGHDHAGAVHLPR